MAELVYLAARYELKEQMCEVAERLNEVGIGVTSRWIRGQCDGLRGATAAEIDLEDLALAGSLVLFSHNREGVGRHIEFGAAMISGKRLFIVGERESVFHHLPNVMVCDTIEELIPLLKAGI